MKINNKAEFGVWLDSNFWLEDAIINTLKPHPRLTTENDNKYPNQVKLIFTLQVEGSLQAGEKRWVRDIEIIARDLQNYSISFENGFIEGYCCQGIELIEVKEGIGFTLNVPGILKVICNQIEVSQSSDREEIVKPWFNPNEFFAYAILGRLPTPEDWLNQLREKNLDVVWRYYYSEEIASARIPKDYTGWFIQLRSRLDENPQGLFFQHCQLTGEKLSLHLRNCDNVSHRLWIEAGKYVATFPEVTISCGNTTMSKTKWLAYLAQFDKERPKS